jgi:hypothetical protein
MHVSTARRIPVTTTPTHDCTTSDHLPNRHTPQTLPDCQHGFVLPFATQMPHAPKPHSTWSLCSNLTGQTLTGPDPSHGGPRAWKQAKVSSADPQQVRMAIRHSAVSASDQTTRHWMLCWPITYYPIIITPACSTTNTGILWYSQCSSGTPRLSSTSEQLPSDLALSHGNTAIHANSTRWQAEGHSQTQHPTVHTPGFTNTLWPIETVQDVEWTWVVTPDQPTFTPCLLPSPGSSGKVGKTRPDAPHATGSYRPGEATIHSNVWGTVDGWGWGGAGGDSNAGCPIEASMPVWWSQLENSYRHGGARTPHSSQSECVMGQTTNQGFPDLNNPQKQKKQTEHS